MAFVLHVDYCPHGNNFSFSVIVEDNSRLDGAYYLNLKLNVRLWWDPALLVASSTERMLPRDVDFGYFTNSHESESIIQSFHYLFRALQQLHGL